MAYSGLWNLDYNQHLNNTNNTSNLNRAGNPLRTGIVEATTMTQDEINRRLQPGEYAWQDENGIWRRGEANPMNPNAGQWGRWQNPVGDGFTGMRNNTNYFRGQEWSRGAYQEGEYENWLLHYLPMLQRSLDSNSAEYRSNEELLTRLRSGQFLNGASRPNTGNPLVTNTGQNPFGPNSNPFPGATPRAPSTGLFDPSNPNGLTRPPDNTTTLNNPLTRTPGGGLINPNNPVTAEKGGNIPVNTERNPNNPITNRPLGPPRIFPNDRDGRNPRAQAEWERILNGQNPWGSLGQFEQNFRLNDPNYNWEGVPEWIRNQYTWNPYAGSGESQTGETGLWQRHGNQGQFVDRNGRSVVRIGDRASDAIGEGDNSVINWSAVWYDPELGMVTSPENLRHRISDAHRNLGNVVYTAIALAAAYVGWGLLSTDGGALTFAGEGGATYTIPEELLTSMTTTGGQEAVVAALQNAPTILPAGATGATLTGSGVWQAVVNGATWVWDNIRGIWQVASAINTVNNVVNNNNRQPNRNGNNMPNPEDNNIPVWLREMLGGGLSAYQSNRNLQWFQDQSRDLIDRFDYNREYRPGYLAAINRYMMDPTALFNDPNYLAMENQELGNLERRFNARGYNFSGNEMGGLMDHQRTMRTNYTNQRLTQLHRMATMGNPEGLAGNALQALGRAATMRNNRDAGNNAMLSRLFGNGGIGQFLNSVFRAGGDLLDTVQRWLGGEWGPASLENMPPDPELRAMLEEAADRNGQTVNQFVQNFQQMPPEFTINWGDEEWWEEMFGGEDNEDFWSLFDDEDFDIWSWFFGDE